MPFLAFCFLLLFLILVILDYTKWHKYYNPYSSVDDSAHHMKMGAEESLDLW